MSRRRALERLRASSIKLVVPQRIWRLSEFLEVIALLGTFLTLSVFISASASASAGFSTNNPLNTPAILVAHPENVVLETITTAGNRLIAGGEHGVIIVSEDNGITWRQVPVPVDATINQIRFVTSNIGWAVGSFGLVLKTLDGGDHWSKQLDGIQAAGLMVQNAQQQLAATPNDPVATRRLHHAQLFVSDGPDKPFLFIQIESPAHLRVYGAYGISFESMDGGKDWTDWSRHFDDAQYLHPYGLAQTQHAVVIAGEQGMLLLGPPNGPIVPIASPNKSSFFGIIASPREGLLTFGLLGKVYVSRDHAATWAGVENASTATINCAAITKDGHILLGDWFGNVSELIGDKIVSTNIQSGFPIADILEAPDQSLVLVGTGGIKRLPPQLWRNAVGDH